MTPEEFRKLVGWEPRDDDMERVNCTKTGQWGHHGCGLCTKCGFPRFVFNGKCQHWHDRQAYL